MRNRPPTSRLERGLSWAVLAALAVIAAGVWRAQFRLNPAVLARRAAPADGGSAAQAGTAPDLFAWMPPTLAPLGPPEAFDAETLSDKIDGKADLYLASGFRRLACRRYGLGADGAVWLEVFLYDMGSPDSAFAVFSNQRRAAARALEGMRNAYAAENAVFLAHGSWYVEWIGSAADARLLAALTDAARAFVAAHPAAAGGGPPEAALFPAAGRLEGSVTLHAADAFGFDRYTHVYSMDYRRDGAPLTAYVRLCASPAEARELRDAFLAQLKSLGGQPLPTPSPDLVGWDLDGYLDVVFARGRIIGGVHEAGQAAPAAALAADLLAAAAAAPEGQE